MFVIFFTSFGKYYSNIDKCYSKSYENPFFFTFLYIFNKIVQETH